jgi:proteasome beta subunit
MAGLAVVPLFVGFDLDAEQGRIVSFDVTGGRYEERGGYDATGSGSVYAKSSLKKLYNPEADRDEAINAAIQALYDAADDDSATGGPDLARRIYPTVAVITADHGAEKLTDAETASVAEAVVAQRAAHGGR